MLVVIVGPMFADKTTELIRRVERQVIAGGGPSSLSLL